MDRRGKFRKLAITAGMTLGIFSGLLGFAVGVNKAQGGGAVGFGFVVGLMYFGVVFGVILLIYKVFDWAIFGLHTNQAKDKGISKALAVRHTCRRIALVSSILIALLCGFTVGFFPAGQYREAKSDLELLETQSKDYKGKAYYDYMQRERMEDNYWLNLSRGGLVGLCIFAGFLSSVFCFLAVWFIYKFFERLVLNICNVTDED
jgi:hypothetical protein